ncbi:MAG: DUF5715 family protein [Acidobacteriota bacterium]
MKQRIKAATTTALVSCLLLLAAAAEAQSLRGSSRSMDRQNHQARAHDYTFLATPSQVQRFVRRGWLVRVRPNADFEMYLVSFPYARAEVKLFIERLSQQYRSACGEKLVVTSLTRPKSNQPPNASWRSVHPTGMALDIRRPRNRSCRRWLERVLLSLEGERVLEATYERRPPHYHIALFPKPYARYVARVQRGQGGDGRTYRVARGDTLWEIARKHKTTVNALKRENDLNGNQIRPGQVLQVPD